MNRQGVDSIETAHLLERVREGDPAAVNELFARHRGYLCQVVDLRLPRKLRARVDASDIVQEAQLEATRRLPGYLQRPALPFRLWLRRITQDRLLMAHRRHVEAAKRTVERDVALPEGSSVHLAQELLGIRNTPSEQLAQKEMVRRVREAVAALPDVAREILLMRNYEGLSNKEVAQVLGVDPATSSRRYGRALLHLRERLMEDGLRTSEL